MKPTTLFALSSLALALPCAAQTSIVQHGRHGFPNPPEQKAQLAIESEMRSAGVEALHNADFISAEADFRKSIQASAWSPGYYGLGEALAGQGRIAEAIEAYRAGIYGPPYTVAVLNDIPKNGLFNPNVRNCPGAAGAEAWMKYALLLSQSGQSSEAVVVFNKALPQVPDIDDQTITLFPDANTLSAAAFQASVHIALGLCAAFSGDSLGGCHKEAMSEFNKAQQLQPDAPLTNYYYGYGWQQLSPAEQAQFGSFQQAKAALQKAARLGKGAVKKAALKALQVAMKPQG